MSVFELAISSRSNAIRICASCPELFSWAKLGFMARLIVCSD